MPDDPLSGMTPDEKRLFETVQRRGQEPTMPDDPRSVAWEQYRWHGADDAGGSERPPQWRYAFDAGWDACARQYAARLQQADRVIDELKGIVGLPARADLERYGLSDSLPDRVRYACREWLTQTHAAQQRVLQIQAQAERDRAFIRRLARSGIDTMDRSDRDNVLWTYYSEARALYPPEPDPKNHDSLRCGECYWEEHGVTPPEPQP